MDQLLLSPEEVAASLRIGRTRVYALLGAGSLPSIRIGKSVRVSAEDLRRWVAEQKREARA
jgi:excisionase family DNA binding protein